MKNILFIHVPKTAGSTIYKSFNLDRIVRHATINYLQIKKNIDINEYWIIGSVRNPWVRTVSLYNWCKIVGNHNLEWKTWLYDSPLVGHLHYQDELNNNPLKQVNYFLDKDGNVAVDEVIQLENIKNDIKKSNYLNGKIHNKNIRNTSTGWKIYYDLEDIEYIREQSLWEIDKFGYKFE